LAADPAQRPLASAALLLEFYHQVRGGAEPRPELLDRGLALEGPAPSRLAATIPAIYWKGVDEHDLARARLTALLDQAVARGDEPAQHDLHTHLGEAELSAGRYAAAARHLRLAHELGTQLGTGLVGENWLLGLLDAHRGDLDAADRAAAAGLAEAERTGDAWCLRIHRGLAAFVTLSAGRMAESAAHHAALAGTIDLLGLKEPLSQRFEADWVEACVGAGDLDGAAAALARLARRHDRLPRPWTTLGLARGQALLDAARGRDHSPALTALLAARDTVPADVVPLERARCLLVAGMVLRRARKRTAARTALSTAEAEFTALGAAAFAARTRTEAARLGARRATSTDLSPTEARVARLAAAGGTNRAIAEQMFLSPKTVEANLARVYRKLGIASRAELGAAMAALPER
jgi:DNA-binding CsgD family transcriptional regulator